ncbi:MAG: phosphotransferase family protein [Gammaproteobacteria bacterium]|nr:phosphotransferase family protein [Gammaproteobacteria bacterium]
MVEGIDENNVVAWLEKEIPELSLPLSFSLIAGGHSNLTFHCEDSSANGYVLRRPPLGQVLESAHDMGREYKIIRSLKDTRVPVPASIALCTDKSINGADFYFMKFVEGEVLNDSVSASLLREKEKQSISKDVAKILCDLHALEPDEIGLGDLGRKEDYLARQIKRWVRQWEASKTHEIPEMEESCQILTEKMPQQMGATIVHGDFRLGNMIVSEGNVRAVLDWELCTLGDPLADLGYVLNNWVTLDEVPEPGEGDQSPTAVGGFFSRQKFLDFYAQETGRDVSNIDYYRAFSHWRLAAIGQGVYRRYLVGAMGKERDVDLEKQKNSVARRASSALELLSRS